jgi:hypothetical protein
MIYLLITLYFCAETKHLHAKAMWDEGKKNDKPMPHKIIDEEDIQIYRSKYTDKGTL